MSQHRLPFVRFRAMQQASAFFMAVCLALPSPAFALRQTGLEEQTDDQGNSVGPKAKLIAALRSPTATAAIPPLSPTLPISVAGVEETQVAELLRKTAPFNVLRDNRLSGVLSGFENRLATGDVSAILSEWRRQGIGNATLPLKEHFDFLDALGKRTGLKGSITYGPMGGFDVHTLFGLSKETTDVYSVGLDSFGRVEDLVHFFEKADADDLVGGYYAGLDHQQNYQSMKQDYGLLGLGGIVLARIRTFLGGTLEGVHYFTIQDNGEVRFLSEQEIAADRDYDNAVVVYRDAQTGNAKHFWYIKHDFHRGGEGFDPFIQRLSFQNLIIKGAPNLWSTPGFHVENLARSISSPAMMNHARVLSDVPINVQGNRVLSEVLHPVWALHPKPGQHRLNDKEFFGYSRPGDLVFFGNAAGMEETLEGILARSKSQYSGSIQAIEAIRIVEEWLRGSPEPIWRMIENQPQVALLKERLLMVLEQDLPPEAFIGEIQTRLPAVQRESLLLISSLFGSLLLTMPRISQMTIGDLPGQPPSFPDLDKKVAQVLAALEPKPIWSAQGKELNYWLSMWKDDPPDQLAEKLASLAGWPNDPSTSYSRRTLTLYLEKQPRRTDDDKAAHYLDKLNVLLLSPPIQPNEVENSFTALNLTSWDVVDWNPTKPPPNTILVRDDLRAALTGIAPTHSSLTFDSRVARQLIESKRSIWVYGSVVNGFPRMDSDVDLTFDWPGMGWVAFEVSLDERQPSLVKWITNDKVAASRLRQESRPALELTADQVFVLTRGSTRWGINGDRMVELFRQNQSIRDQIRTSVEPGSPLKESEIALQAAEKQQRILAQAKGGLEELVPLAQPLPPFQQIPDFIQVLQAGRLVEIDGYTYLQQGRHGGDVPDEIIRAGITDSRGVQPGERRFAVLLDAPSTDLLEIAQLFDQIGVPPKAVPEGVKVVSAAPKDKAWENPQAVKEAREKVSRDITDLDAFLVDATRVTVEEISQWVRPGVKATIARVSPATLAVFLAERPNGQDIESILRAAHRKRGEIFDVEEVAIINYQGYRIAIMRAA